MKSKGGSFEGFFRTQIKLVAGLISTITGGLAVFIFHAKNTMALFQNPLSRLAVYCLHRQYLNDNGSSSPHCIK